MNGFLTVGQGGESANAREICFRRTTHMCTGGVRPRVSLQTHTSACYCEWSYRYSKGFVEFDKDAKASLSILGIGGFYQ